MIQIQTKLSQEPVYIAGEIVECVISFKNISQPCETNSPEILAWASAQLHCYCSVDETKVPLPSSYRCGQSTGTKETSFVPNQGEKGFEIYSSQPTILLCDLRLLPGDVKTFVYREKLPPELPPSFGGSMVRYSHKISIGTQKISAFTKILKVPLKVFRLDEFCQQHNGELVEDANPFLTPPPKQNPVDIAMEHLEDLTAPKQQLFFNITRGQSYVARFCLLKSNYRLGEDIVGTFDFTKATIPCVQYSVQLQSIEKTADAIHSTILSYSKAHEVCLLLKQTHLALPIPVHVSPTFKTELIDLSWRLHFEFVMTPEDVKALPPELLEDVDNDWEPPSKVDVITMVWNLPVNIFPTHSAHVAARLNLQREFYNVL